MSGEGRRGLRPTGIREEWNAQGIDVLVNNAGVGSFAPAGDITPEGFMRTALSGQTAPGRVGEPEDIADAITALVSPELHWVTGERIEVYGGVLL